MVKCIDPPRYSCVKQNKIYFLKKINNIKNYVVNCCSAHLKGDDGWNPGRFVDHE
jgi:hypothetical protein